MLDKSTHSLLYFLLSETDGPKERSVIKQLRECACDLFRESEKVPQGASADVAIYILHGGPARASLSGSALASPEHVFQVSAWQAMTHDEFNRCVAIG